MKNVIRGDNGAQYTLVDGKLIESGLAGFNNRKFNLASLGKILRGYKTTKLRSYKDQKSIHISNNSGKTYFVKVAVDGTTRMGIGCVCFSGDNAKVLRRAALKSSKVLA